MKTKIVYALFMSVFTLSACNSGGDNTGNAEATKTSETTEHASTTEDKDLKVVNAKYNDVDAKVSTSVQQIIQHYLHLKNALAADNANEAGEGAKALNQALAALDQSTLTSEQKAVFEDTGSDLKEMAEHIATKRGDIAHQREHFALLSEDVYTIASTFGAGKTLYQQHCPMYNDNKGARWLSETKEIQNPYYGKKMLKCGAVEKLIK